MATTQNPGRQNRPPGLIRPAGLVRQGIAAAPLPTVELDARTIADFLNGVCEGYGELADVLPEDRVWLEKARAELKASLGANSPALSCIEFVSELARLAINDRSIRTAADLVAAVDKLTDAELLDFLLSELVASEEFGPSTRRALEGDGASWEELKQQLLGHKGHAVITGTLMEMPQAIRDVIRAWLPKYQEVEERIGRMLVRDVADRSMADAARDPLGFVENATNGIRVTPEHGLRVVHLIGTYFGRPYNSVTRIGDTLVLVYPIADSSVGASSRLTPPAGTLRLYRALGDETRLRILRLLADQDRYLTELANELELSKPTISHHLAQLRSAGLVTVVEEGNLTFYTLRRDRIAQAGPELGAFLAQ